MIQVGRNIPELEGNLLFRHESGGHWPYEDSLHLVHYQSDTAMPSREQLESCDCGCDACVQARGRTPARRVRKKNEGD